MQTNGENIAISPKTIVNKVSVSTIDSGYDGGSAEFLPGYHGDMLIDCEGHSNQPSEEMNNLNSESPKCGEPPGQFITYTYVVFAVRSQLFG